MCGIAGIVKKQVTKDEVARMLTSISHRGPDGHGVWVSEDQVVGFGHRRLAIIDLSPGGHQPMHSENKRFTITFNGEIYNYEDLKKQLERVGHTFRSTSDTEVLLAAFVEWGTECLDKLNGMFAFAIWDNKKKELFAARDRLGEKPFKYYYNDQVFIFASEIKALLNYPGISREIDPVAIDIALTFRFVPSPRTGFKHIRKLGAGEYLQWKAGQVTIQKYWNSEPREEKKDLSIWKEELWGLFRDSVQKRMVSDVPLGAFLSGGIDSTSVVAAVREITKNPIDTFVISIGGVSEDQKYARIASKYFNTTHHEIELSDVDYESVIPKLGQIQDEPFFDQSMLPSVLISEQIKKKVTVILSGDGGDELFGGYASYKFAEFLINYQRLPKMVYKKIIPFLTSFSKKAVYYNDIVAEDFYKAYTEYYALWKSSLPKSKKYITKHELYKDEFLAQDSKEHAVELMRTLFGKNKDRVNGAMNADISGRLPDGYLAKIDAATMFSALETRPPFLDHRLVTLSQQLPSALKLRGGKQKFIWSEIVKDKIPTEIRLRPKVGFTVPLHDILNTRLKVFVEDTICTDSAKINVYFNKKTIQQVWKDHESRRADYSNHLWSLIMLELWLKNYAE